jgi:cytochrome oxidase complex assembly protein 1
MHQGTSGQIPPEQIENTSGQGERAVVPPDIKRWNWGAFLLNWIWGIGNDTYIALLCFVPVVNIVMPFVLGAKGSEWAWRNKRWRDVAHFRRVQRIWAIVGAALLGVGIAFFALFFTLFFVLFGRSEAYRTAVAELKASPTAISELGTPITAGFPSGNIRINNDTGSARLSFSASGPKATGTVFVTETLRNGHWVITSMQLQLKERRINLVGRSVESDGIRWRGERKLVLREIAGVASKAW